MKLRPANTLSSDDSFIVSPFKNVFQFIPNVPYEIASKVLDLFNTGPRQKRDELGIRDFDFTPLLGDTCPEDSLSQGHRSLMHRSSLMTRGLHYRQNSYLNPGYVTTGKPPQSSNQTLPDPFLDSQTHIDMLQMTSVPTVTILLTLPSQHTLNRTTSRPMRHSPPMERFPRRLILSFLISSPPSISCRRCSV